MHVSLESVNHYLSGTHIRDFSLGLCCAVDSFCMARARAGRLNTAPAPDDIALPKAILSVADGGSVTTQTCRAFTETEYRQIIGGLNAWRLARLYTDGITEAVDEWGEEFGDENIIRGYAIIAISPATPQWKLLRTRCVL